MYLWQWSKITLCTPLVSLRRRFLRALSKRKINIKFLLASFKTHTGSKDCSKSRIKFLLQLSSLADFLHCTVLYIHDLLSEQFSGSQADSETTFRVTYGLLESWNKLCEKGYWKDLTITVQYSGFIEASRNFILDVLDKKTAQNCEIHRHSFKKHLFDFKGIVSRDKYILEGH